jgi:hypoxanthine phosphoribosyltransferase
MYKISPEHPYQVILMLVCKVIYFFERRARIKKGIRNDFSSFHAFEHVGLYLLFKNVMEVDLYFPHYVIAFFSLNFMIWLALKFLNEYLYHNMLARAPTWVRDSPELTVLLKSKLIKNKDSMKLHNYVCKPWTAHLKLEFVTWDHMIEICDNMLKRVNADDYDHVIGITTGGSFVGTYVAKKLNKPYASILSKLWSDSGLKLNVLQTYRYFMKIEQKPRNGEIPVELKGKRVLLIDDTTYTGITLAGIKKVILEKGEAHSVTTMVMWMRGQYFPDHFYSTKRIPILWEWGAELD